MYNAAVRLAPSLVAKHADLIESWQRDGRIEAITDDVKARRITFAALPSEAEAEQLAESFLDALLAST